MVRRSTPAKKYDEETFAVRVRFAIPELGLRCLPDVHLWLRENAPKSYAIHSTMANGVEPQLCGLLYTNTLPLALECVTNFNLQVYGLPKLTP